MAALLLALNWRYSPSIFLASSIVAALGLQHLLGWLPCPLCILQRLSALALLCALVLASATTGTARALALLLGWVVAGVGLFFGGAHLYLLAYPQVAQCGPGLAMTMANLAQALPGSDWLLAGAGACDDARYQLFGLPLPLWSIAVHAFAGFWAFQVLGRKCN